MTRTTIIALTLLASSVASAGWDVPAGEHGHIVEYYSARVPECSASACRSIEREAEAAALEIARIYEANIDDVAPGSQSATEVDQLQGRIDGLFRAMELIGGSDRTSYSPPPIDWDGDYCIPGRDLAPECMETC